jgi:type II secretory pathway component PulF
MATNAENTGGGPKRLKRSTKKRATSVTDAAAEDDFVVRTSDSYSSGLINTLTRRSVRYNDVTRFLRQFILLIERALKTLAQRGKRAELRGLIADIAQYVEGGNPLWQCFDRHPRYFSEVEVNLIRASEASGTLVTVLRRMTEYREARDMLRRRVRGAMIYPVILLVACVGVLLLLTNFVVPEFESMFIRQNLEIPEITRLFLLGSDWFRLWWWTPVACVFLLMLLYRGWYVRNELRRLRADRLKLSIPILGSIIHKNAIVELTRTMGLLLRSGLSMMATLELTRKAINNRAVAESLQAVRDSVEQGGGLEPPLRAAAPVIPDEVTDMFVTGEESGRVDQVAEQIAEAYDEQVKIAVMGLGEALQPLFTVIVGGAVLLLFVALFWPIVSMIEQIASSGG